MGITSSVGTVAGTVGPVKKFMANELMTAAVGSSEGARERVSEAQILSKSLGMQTNDATEHARSNTDK